MSAPFTPPHVGRRNPPPPPPDWLGAPPMSRGERAVFIAICILGGIMVAGVVQWAVWIGKSLATLAGRCS